MHFIIKFLLCDSPIILIFGSVPDFLTKSLPFRPINLLAFLIAFLQFNLGGEQSGHIILGKFATTGDGLLVALEVLFSMRKGKKASELFNNFKSTPQILENVSVKDKSIVSSSRCKKAIRIASKLIKNQGRMLVRKSGTEPKIRIMGESDNKVLLSKCINIVKRSIK